MGFIEANGIQSTAIGKETIASALGREIKCNGKTQPMGLVSSGPLSTTMGIQIIQKQVVIGS